MKFFTIILICYIWRIAECITSEVVYPKKTERSGVRHLIKPHRHVLAQRLYRPHTAEVSAEMETSKSENFQSAPIYGKKQTRTRVHIAVPLQNFSGIYTVEDYSHYGSAVNGVPSLSGDENFDKSTLKEVLERSKQRESDLKQFNSKDKITGKATILTSETSRPRIMIANPSKQLLRTTSVKSESLFQNANKSKINQNSGFRGRPYVTEIDLNLKRTTMSESSMKLIQAIELTTPETTFSQFTTTISPSSMTTTTTSIVNGFVRIQAHPRLDSLSGTKSVQSHVAKHLNEKRFPAQDWQLPPSLKKLHRVENNSPKPRTFVNNFDTGVNQIFHYQSSQSPYLLSEHPRPLHSPFRVITSALTQNYDEIQSLPKPGFHFSSINQSLNHNKTTPAESQLNHSPKYRDTFAKHNDIIKPLPLPSISDNDMDLLMPASSYDIAEVPALSIKINNQSKQLNYQVFTEDPLLPVPILPVAINGGSVPQTSLPIITNTHGSGLDPNAKLSLCCQKQQLGPSCQMLCNFDTFTDRTLVSIFLTNTCPDPQRALAFECATTKVDHTECCVQKGLQTYAGGQCMPFCATHIPTPPNVFSYLPCLQVFNVIKTCYKDYQLTHPNILDGKTLTTSIYN